MSPEKRQLNRSYFALTLLLVGGFSILLGVVIAVVWVKVTGVAHLAQAKTTAPAVLGQEIPPKTSAEVATTNSSLAQTPIELYYTTSKQSLHFSLNEAQLNSLMITKAWGTQSIAAINPSNLDEQISRLAGEINHTNEIETLSGTITAPDRLLDEQKLKATLRDELLNRRRGQTPKTSIDLASFVREVPGTNGTVAAKYIEVDKSQQKLYQWENGKVYQTRVISTGKSGPTYTGIKHIKNKFPNAWSPVGLAWTPYWMAFDYNQEAKAYLGFHELPYWDGPGGEKIRRPFDTLGEPVTGGCIQLNIGAAKEVYDWAEVGMTVIIHE